MNNGVCPIHRLYKGNMLDENLFAAFVRALFSFAKDMSEDEGLIRNMTLGEMDIHYMPEPDTERFICAISADLGTKEDELKAVLEFVVDLFRETYPIYIEKLPPFEPASFEVFEQVLDAYTTFTEDKYASQLTGQTDVSLQGPVVSVQHADEFVALTMEGLPFVSVYRKNPFILVGGYYPESGDLVDYSLQKTGHFLTLLSTTGELVIVPLPLGAENEIDRQILQMGESVTWVRAHPVQPLLFYGNDSEVHVRHLLSGEVWPLTPPNPFKQVFPHVTGQVFLVDQTGVVWENIIQNSAPPQSFQRIQPSWDPQPVKKIFFGPNNNLLLAFEHGAMMFWDGKVTHKPLFGSWANNLEVAFNDENDLTFVLTGTHEFSLYNEEGEQLVSYNLVEPGSGVFLSEKKQLLIIHATGVVKQFSGMIDRKQIEKHQVFLSRRVETIEKHLARIHAGVQKIIDLLGTDQTSTEIRHSLNQVRVFRQQMKKLIPERLVERTSIFLGLYQQVGRQQSEIDKLFEVLDDLEPTLERSFEQVKEDELSGKSVTERINNYIDRLKPRQQVGIGTLAKELGLTYQEVLSHLQNLEKSGVLAGFLTRGFSGSLADNVVFVKKDPKFSEESGITSF